MSIGGGFHLVTELLTVTLKKHVPEPPENTPRG